jgi:tRNA dimethylallyltransferase
MLSLEELAVELATRFKGEIINADAMQMYKGLPIITNKISLPEQRSIPHHLLGHIDLDQETWVVGDFKRAAKTLIREIRSRGRLPIVVGGTQYYTDGLLFEDVLLGAEEHAQHSILEQSTEVMLAKLREVDPVMAEKWHPNDRRKIQRSLQIYLNTGRQASEVYAEQKTRKVEPSGVEGGDQSPWETLLFWVYSRPEVLKERVTKRVDKMLDRNLLGETDEMYHYLQQKRAEGQDIDLHKGIWQSIGFKQFEPYHRLLDTSPDDVEMAAKLKAQGLDEMKGATRRYSKYQTRWISYKLIPRLQEEHDDALDHLFVVDSTDLSKWSESVVAPASAVTEKFLSGEPLPKPTELSGTARDVIAAGRDAEASSRSTPCQKTCEICHTTSVSEETWQMHIQSRRHRRAKQKVRRRALIPYQPPDLDQRASESDSGRSSGPIGFPL